MVDCSRWRQAPKYDLLGRVGRVEIMASITISPIQMKRFSAPDNVEPSELRELAGQMEELAIGVEELWEEMSPKLREAFTALAYMSSEPPKGIAGRYGAALRGGLWYARIRLKGEQEALFDFGIARRRLTNSILAAIERDNPAHQRALSEAVEGAFSSLEENEALGPEETSEQLRRLSDEALK